MRWLFEYTSFLLIKKQKKRTDHVYTDLVTTEEVFDAVQTKSLLSLGLATGVNPPSLTKKTNELDLEIHLSYISRKKKGMESKDVSACNPTVSIGSINRSTMETLNFNGPHY